MLEIGPLAHDSVIGCRCRPWGALLRLARGSLVGSSARPVSASFCHFHSVGRAGGRNRKGKPRSRRVGRMEVFVQQLINGITLGSIYGLIAIGYTMVFGIIGMVNFAHGDVFMV